MVAVQEKNSNESGGIGATTNLENRSNAQKFIAKRLKHEVMPFAKELSFAALALIISGILFLYVRSHINNLEFNKQTKASQLELVDRGIVESKNSLLVWDEVKNQLKNRRGLDIEAFRSIVERIQLKHAISDLEIILTTPTTRNDSEKYKFVRLEFNEIEVGFSSITDVEAYRFLVELMNNVPGILHIEKFEMNARTDIEEVIVATLKEGEIQSMVEISVLFKWHNIIDL